MKSLLNSLRGWMRIWFVFNCAVFIFAFLCHLTNYNYYFLVPDPFSDLMIHLFNNNLDIIYELHLQSEFSFALNQGFSTSFVTGVFSFLIGKSISWIVQGFKKPNNENRDKKIGSA